jgi:inner membrane protein
VASVLSHAVAALSIGTCFYRPHVSTRFWAAGVFGAVLPDLDVIGLRFGVPNANFWGHRGFTHSLVFAALLASVVAVIAFRSRAAGIGRFPLFLYLFLATASHCILDAQTDGGLGVAFFSPFDDRRFFLPWRPIRVSPLAFGRFFSLQGYLILKNELLWIWFPAALFAVLVLMIRRPQRATADCGGLTKDRLLKING